MHVQGLGLRYAPARAIDFGCGPGAGLSAATQVWASLVDLVGVDSSPGMLRAAEILNSAPDDHSAAIDKQKEEEVSHEAPPKQLLYPLL